MGHKKKTTEGSGDEGFAEEIGRESCGSFMSWVADIRRENDIQYGELSKPRYGGFGTKL